ncbi:uncharacterized protein BDCG_04135 [Blastomyces dermatitidis ER-3]|uniref:Uncharacterized protein n=2 Tax=Ajellomyces dermatitidis TaxID=5039 RepID=F2TJ05_AJEDA|nr:uncharacterized protein BDCG_04135 [Blastomyces dermatitidis ER-3]EEQ89015.1 hypothetical protein BDCG_04135 [Blastomyces dermatitidis ER-3]EGE83218.1 hypothetical protein BDDG_06162 [Blastomyces dermatitidis ATCC 18188]EQL28664.1 hypothetical protein BDFG_08622 [Blastomyces dermatitidis ATCC 26199]
MLFQRGQPKDSEHVDQMQNPGNLETGGKPLVGVIFFFASQMSRNIQTARIPSGVEPSSHSQSEPPKVHRLDNFLSEVQEHAHASPLVTKFETIPIEMAPPSRPRETTRDAMHDTLLLVNFKNKQAWQEWIQTK